VQVDFFRKKEKIIFVFCWQTMNAFSLFSCGQQEAIIEYKMIKKKFVAADQ
jgi:hypothetical protein